jgi:AraC family transcriptional regulator
MAAADRTRTAQVHMRWPKLVLRSASFPATGERRVKPTTRHHLWLFRRSVVVGVRTVGQPGWRTLAIAAGEIVLRPARLPAQDNRWEATGPFDVLHVALPKRFPAPRWLLEPYTIFKLNDPVLPILIGCLHEAAQGERDRGRRYVEAASELLLLHVAESFVGAQPATGPGALSGPVLRRVCAHVDANLSRPVRIAALASIAGLSERQFLRAFRASTGQAPARFVQRRRVLLAEELLRSSELSLVEIAHAAGFGSQSRFSTAFRSTVGDSPARYRKNHLVE